MLYGVYGAVEVCLSVCYECTWLTLRSYEKNFLQE